MPRFSYITPAVGANGKLQAKKNDAEISVAVLEMQRANYFTFVTLMNMVRDKLPSNATFLMPNDRVLATTTGFLLPENGGVLEFVLRHSIPSPLLYDDMKLLPTGTVVPTCLKNYAVKICNSGRQDFHFNNVRLVSINLCTSGVTFRCHGVDGVLQTTTSMPEPAGNSIGHAPVIALAPAQAPSLTISPAFPESPTGRPFPVLDPAESPAPAPGRSTASMVLSSFFSFVALVPCFLLLFLVM